MSVERGGSAGLLPNRLPNLGAIGQGYATKLVVALQILTPLLF